MAQHTFRSAEYQGRFQVRETPRDDPQPLPLPFPGTGSDPGLRAKLLPESRRGCQSPPRVHSAHKGRQR